MAKESRWPANHVHFRRVHIAHLDVHMGLGPQEWQWISILEQVAMSYNLKKATKQLNEP